MKLKLYHYVHCPFCVRVRMTLSYLRLSYESVVLPYDDEVTPLKLTGKKMLPIMEIDGSPMNESLDIMTKIDSNNLLRIPDHMKEEEFKDLSMTLDRLGSLVHSLAMPYWIYTPEFNDSSRAYFQTKKEQKRGPFKDLVKNQRHFIDELNKEFSVLTKNLKPFYGTNSFSVYDILVAAHLWGLYVVPEFQFPDTIHQYLQNVKDVCNFNYHADFWS